MPARRAPKALAQEIAQGDLEPEEPILDKGASLPLFLSLVLLRLPPQLPPALLGKDAWEGGESMQPLAG